MVFKCRWSEWVARHLNTINGIIGNIRIINKWLFRRSLNQLDVVVRKEETCFIFGRVWRAGLLIYFEKAANRWYCVSKDADTLQLSRIIFQLADFYLNRASTFDDKQSKNKEQRYRSTEENNILIYYLHF